MTASELYQKLAERAGVSKSDSERVIKALIEETLTAVKSGDEIKLNGLMVVFGKKMKARKGRNPITGQIVDLPERLRIGARFSGKAQEMVAS